MAPGSSVSVLQDETVLNVCEEMAPRCAFVVVGGLDGGFAVARLGRGQWYFRWDFGPIPRKLPPIEFLTRQFPGCGAEPPLQVPLGGYLLRRRFRLTLRFVHATLRPRAL